MTERGIYHDIWTAGICPELVEPRDRTNWVWDLPSGQQPITFDNWAEGEPSYYGGLLHLTPTDGHKFDHVSSYDGYSMRFICEVKL